MASKFTDEIEKGVADLINCLICTELYKQPKVLSCQHTFCCACLARYHDNYNQQRIIKVSNFPCPACRKTVYLPPGGIAALPNDFKVGQISDVFDKMNVGSRDKGAACDVCRYEQKDVDAERFCVQCSKYLCTLCGQQHADSTLFRTHSTITLDGAADAASVLECEKHRGEEIRYYCVPCSAALCTVCALGTHAKHQIADVTAALEQLREDLRKDIEALRTRGAEHEAAAERAATIREQHKQSAETSRENIEKHVLACREKLDEAQAQLIDELADAQAVSEDRLRAEEKTAMATVAAIQSACDSAEQLVPQSVQLLASAAPTQRRLTSLLARPVKTLSSDLTAPPSFQSDMQLNIGSICSRPQHLSGLKLTLNTTVAPPSSAVAAALKRSASTNSPQMRRRRQQQQQQQQEEGGGGGAVPCREGLKLLWTTPVDSSETRDVAFLPDGSLVTTEYRLGSNKLAIYSSSGQLLRTSSSQLVKPWGVAVNSQAGSVVVTDHGDSSIKFVDADMRVSQTWRRLFERPSGVAVMRSGELVISDTGERHLHKLSVYLPNGIRVRDFGSRGREQGQVLQPHFVAVDHHDRIIVADTALRCVKVMDRLGRQLVQIGDLDPSGVAIDPLNNMVVADRAAGAVKLYSPDGKLIDTLHSSDNLPWGIGVHDSGVLAIATDKELQMVQVPSFKAP